MSFFVSFIFTCSFSGCWRQNFPLQHVYATCVSQAAFLSSTFYTGVLFFPCEGYRQLPNHPLQSVLCRYCKAKLIFSVLGYSITLSETAWGGAIKMYQPSLVRGLEDAWKVLSAPDRLCKRGGALWHSNLMTHTPEFCTGISCIFEHSKRFRMFQHLEIKGFLSYGN